MRVPRHRDGEQRYTIDSPPLITALLSGKGKGVIRVGMS